MAVRLADRDEWSPTRAGLAALRAIHRGERRRPWWLRALGRFFGIRAA